MPRRRRSEWEWGRCVGALAVGAVDAPCEQIVAGADRDGDVLVLCGATFDRDHHLRGSSRRVCGPSRIRHRARARRRPATLVGCSSTGWRIVLDRRSSASRSARCRSCPHIRGERTRSMSPDRRAVLDGVIFSSQDAVYRCGGPPTRRRAVVRQLIVSGAGAHRGGRRRHPASLMVHRRRDRPVGEVSRGGPKRGGTSAFLRPLGGRIGNVSIADVARWASIKNCRNPVPIKGRPWNAIAGSRKLSGLTVDQDGARTGASFYAYAMTDHDQIAARREIADVSASPRRNVGA